MQPRMLTRTKTFAPRAVNSVGKASAAGKASARAVTAGKASARAVNTTQVGTDAASARDGASDVANGGGTVERHGGAIMIRSHLIRTQGCQYVGRHVRKHACVPRAHDRPLHLCR